MYTTKICYQFDDVGEGIYVSRKEENVLFNDALNKCIITIMLYQTYDKRITEIMRKESGVGRILLSLTILNHMSYTI